MKIEFAEYGFDGEDNSRLIEVSVDKALWGKRVWLEFQKPKGEKKASRDLSGEIDEQGIIYYFLPSDLLNEVGTLKIQVVVSELGFVKKSKIYDFYVSRSINAVETLGRSDDSVLSILDIIQTDGDGSKYLSDDGSYKPASEIDVMGFQEAMENISGYVIGKKCSTINEVLTEINRFYEKAKIVVNAFDSDSGAPLDGVTWTVMGATKEEDGYYYLYSDGTKWTMMVQCNGYVTQRVEFYVSEEEARIGLKEFSINMVLRS